MSYCPECRCNFSSDPSEETSIDDHGMCVACHKAWQMGEGELMRVLEFRHVGPFDGCFHRFEYLAVESDGTVDWIVFTPGHLMAYEVVDLAKGCFEPDEFDPVGSQLHASLFKDFAWYEWGQEIFQEIPHGYVPAFWKFAQERGLDFIWVCDECGAPQTDEPLSMAGWRGNGGVGIEVTGWLCEDCALEQMERYYGRTDEYNQGT